MLNTNMHNTYLLDTNCKNKHAYMISIISKHAYKLKIILRISLPLLSIINKGVKTNQTINIYMRYIFMKKRDVKLTPLTYMHLYEKRWLNPNHIKHNMQCIKGDVKLLLHTCTTLTLGSQYTYVNTDIRCWFNHLGSWFEAIST